MLFLTSGCALLGKLESVGCGILPAGKNQEHCYQDAAVRMSSPATCDKILGYGWQEGDGNPRRNKCYRRIAVKTNDPSLCENLEPGRWAEKKEDCYILVAKEMKDARVCDNIDADYTDSDGNPVYNTRQRCYSEVGSTPTYCAGLKDEELVGCLAKEAYNQDDITICEKTDQGVLCILNAGNLYLSEKGWRIPTDQCLYMNDAVNKYFCLMYDALMSGEKETCDHILEPKYNLICRVMSTYSDEEVNLKTDEARDEFKGWCSQLKEPAWKALCNFLYADNLYDTWDGGTSNNDFDLAENIFIKDEANDAWLRFCEYDSEHFTELFGVEASEDPFSMQCIKNLILLADENCDQSDAGEKELCELFSAQYSGDCSGVKDSDMKSFCSNYLVAAKEDINKCKAKESEGKPTHESLQCEDSAKNKLVIRVLGEMFLGVPDSQLNKVLAELSAEGME
ncbi:hypothetical protein JXB31_04750 [Candidatus Woesearchaeota archaeon]|nr:hypothetical protein [Candidatus Woesearchaeota archaeon]